MKVAVTYTTCDETVNVTSILLLLAFKFFKLNLHSTRSSVSFIRNTCLDVFRAHVIENAFILIDKMKLLRKRILQEVPGLLQIYSHLQGHSPFPFPQGNQNG